MNRYSLPHTPPSLEKEDEYIMKKLSRWLKIPLFYSLVFIGATTSMNTILTKIGLVQEVKAQSLATVSAVIKQKLDVFEYSSQTYTLSATPQPGTTVMVFYNGVIQLQGLDYTLAGNALNFSGRTLPSGQIITGQTIGTTPVMQIYYWILGP